MHPQIPAAGIPRLGCFRRNLSAGSIRRFNARNSTGAARVTPLPRIPLAFSAGMAVRHVIDVICSPNGTVRQEAAGADGSASVPGAHPADGDRADSA
jgi:hypothetical protein